MKEYQPDPFRLITWKDLQSVAGLTTTGKRDLLVYYSRLGGEKRRLVMSIWRQAVQTVKVSTEEESAERRAANNLARDNRDEYNDRALLAAIRIVVNHEYTHAQELNARDFRAIAESKRRERWRKSLKHKILRQYDLITKLYDRYGRWSEVIKAIRRKPPVGDPNPFAELRGEKISAKYLASVISEERLRRK